MALNPRRTSVAPSGVPDAAILAKRLLEGDRRALSQAITLVESVHPDHATVAREVLRRTASQAGRARRIGITGIPGAGKSTLIEALGAHYLEAGYRVGVIAVDPSSPASGGSILGDKTRMPTLSVHPHAFVRPSPNRGLLGGLSANTHAVRHLLDAAGYDRILIETVGVGQADVEIQHLVDVTLLLTVPGTGDQLQGIKRGLMETADLIAVHKADGAQRVAARKLAQQLKTTLHLSSSGASVHLTSVHVPERIAALADALDAWFSAPSPPLSERRAQQARTLTRRLVEQRLTTTFWAAIAVQDALKASSMLPTDPLDAADYLYQTGVAALTAT
ncbi:MAG: methylmalonyl Co-A mutase-associated GTPase MeaB [Bacteroidota bacterium]